MTIYKYQVVDAGYKLGKEKNILFATNTRDEAITAAKESGGGALVVKTEGQSEEEIVFVSAYKFLLTLSE